jgi:hypothetical protein
VSEADQGRAPIRVNAPEHAMRQGPVGAYRRAIRIVADERLAVAEVEDDPHHIKVSVHHENGVARLLEAHLWRTPWTNCPGAAAHLKTLEGKTLEEIAGLGVEKAQHCMHLFDITALAATHAREVGFKRLYRVEIDQDEAPPLARIWRDGVHVLEWRLGGSSLHRTTILGAPFDGVPMGELHRHFAGLDRDLIEAALILRRASLISGTRRVDLDAYKDTDSSDNRPANCYARQPERRLDALRRYGMTVDFWGQGRWPLED